MTIAICLVGAFYCSEPMFDDLVDCQIEIIRMADGTKRECEAVG